MAEIEFLLPTVQYGNVKVRATPEELGIDGPIDGGNLGYAYAVFLNLFTQGLRAGSEADVEWQSGGTKPPAPEPILPVGDDGAAIQRVQDGLKPRTVDEANAMAAAIIKQELGASEVDGEDGEPNETSGAAPWDKKVDAKKKPWETSKAAPKAAKKAVEIDW